MTQDNPPQGRSNPVYRLGFQSGSGGAQTSGNAEVTGGQTQGDIRNAEQRRTGGTRIVYDSATGKSYVVPETQSNLAAIEQGRQRELQRRVEAQQKQNVTEAVVASQRRQEASGATGVNYFEDMYNAPLWGIGRSIAEVKALQRKPDFNLEVTPEDVARVNQPIGITQIRQYPPVEINVREPAVISQAQPFYGKQINQPIQENPIITGVKTINTFFGTQPIIEQVKGVEGEIRSQGVQGLLDLDVSRGTMRTVESFKQNYPKTYGTANDIGAIVIGTPLFMALGPELGFGGLVASRQISGGETVPQSIFRTAGQLALFKGSSDFARGFSRTRTPYFGGNEIPNEQPQSFRTPEGITVTRYSSAYRPTVQEEPLRLGYTPKIGYGVPSSRFDIVGETPIIVKPSLAYTQQKIKEVFGGKIIKENIGGGGSALDVLGYTPSNRFVSFPVIKDTGTKAFRKQVVRSGIDLIGTAKVSFIPARPFSRPQYTVKVSPLLAIPYKPLPEPAKTSEYSLKNIGLKDITGRISPAPYSRNYLLQKAREMPKAKINEGIVSYERGKGIVLRLPSSRIRREIRKGIVAKRSINPLDLSKSSSVDFIPERKFATPTKQIAYQKVLSLEYKKPNYKVDVVGRIPYPNIIFPEPNKLTYETRSSMIQRAKEMRAKQAEVIRAGYREGVFKPTLETPKTLRKAFRQGIVAKRSISPLVIPKNVELRFAKVMQVPTKTGFRVVNIATGKVLLDVELAKKTRGKKIIKLGETKATSTVNINKPTEVSSGGTVQILLPPKAKSISAISAKPRANFRSSTAIPVYPSSQSPSGGFFYDIQSGGYAPTVIERTKLGQGINFKERMIPILKNNPNQAIRTNIMQDLISNVSSKSGVTPIQSQPQEQGVSQGQNQFIDVGQSQGQSQGQGVSQGQMQMQSQEISQGQDNIIRTNARTRQPEELIPEIINPKDEKKKNIFLKKLMGKKRLNKAYNVFVGRGKKEKLVGRGLTRGEALALGSARALKGLEATFSIRESGVTTREDTQFIPNQQIFRGYQIRKGQRINLQNTFIQRMKSRLLTKSERTQIKQARQFKSISRGRKSKWF